MSLFRKKSPYDIDHDGLKRKPQRKPVSPEAKKTAILLLINTLVALIVYFTCITLHFYSIFMVYFVLAVVLLFVYIIYNQGFALRGVTPEMLDDSLTLEEKQAKIAAAESRMRSSRWMLTVIIPLIVAVLADFLYVYVLVDLWSLVQSVL